MNNTKSITDEIRKLLTNDFACDYNDELGVINAIDRSTLCEYRIVIERTA